MQALVHSTPRSPVHPLRVGVLASGNGSNLQALLDYIQKNSSSFVVSSVIANVENARALLRAQSAGISNRYIPHKHYKKRSDFENAIIEEMQNHQIELVVLAGFMRVVTHTLLNAFPNRVINIHPALLPSFTGLHAAEQALEANVWFSGCTVHLVNEGVDQGPIIAQAAVPVFSEDSEADLQTRIQIEEHRLLPSVVEAIALGRVLINDRRIHFSDRSVILRRMND